MENKVIKLKIEPPSFYIVLEEPHNVLSVGEDGKEYVFECCWIRFFCSDGDEYHERMENIITVGLKKLIDEYGYNYPIPQHIFASAMGWSNHFNIINKEIKLGEK